MLTKAMALRAIADLNIMYNNANIFFKYKGYDYINSTRFYEIYGHACESNPDPNDVDGDSGSCALYNFLDDNPQYENDEAINFYIPKNTIGFGGTAKFESFRAIVDSYYFGNTGRKTTEHEMGHLLKLEHPHTGWLNETSCEHVTRDPNDVCDPNFPEIPCFNAKSSGDRVVDTAAVPDFRREHYWELIDAGFSEEYAEANDTLYKYIVPLICAYDNINGDDCQETPYDIYTEDVRNLMAYTIPTCRMGLTIGQLIRARETIDVYNHFPEVTNDIGIESLYEPYQGEYYVAGPSTSHNPPLFQPGFTYRFVECSGDNPQPADFDEIFIYNINSILSSFEKSDLDYHSMIHPNHSAILIKHDIFGTEFLTQPKKCYNNFNKASSGGLITKFNDGVFNTNVTITPQDSTSINNQNLIQNLENGLYKIEKSYNDGAVEETVIIKDNN